MRTERTRKGRRRGPACRQAGRGRLFITLAAAGVVIGCYYFLSLPIWEIRDVTVNGARMLVPDEVKALAGIPLSENLFFTSFRRAKHNLNRLTAVKSYHLYRIPPGTVIINIKERTPLASVIFPDRSAIVDADGYVLNHIPNLTLNVPDPADLPVISGLSQKFLLNDGERLDPRVSQVIDSILAEMTTFVKARRLQINLGGLENISLLVDDLLLVKLGSGAEIDRKMRVFEALLPRVNGQWERTQYLDVRFPDNPVILYK